MNVPRWKARAISLDAAIRGKLDRHSARRERLRQCLGREQVPARSSRCEQHRFFFSHASLLLARCHHPRVCAMQ
jgi:hypothetical protein